MSTHADSGAARADHVGARELALEVAGLIGRETLAPLGFWEARHVAYCTQGVGPRRLPHISGMMRLRTRDPQGYLQGSNPSKPQLA
jgi:hypothetical protein